MTPLADCLSEGNVALVRGRIRVLGGFDSLRASRGEGSGE